jgi:hypothetical protein
MPFKKLVEYYASILEFDYTLTPINATYKQMESDAFAKDYKKVNDFFNRFDIKREFYRVMKKIMMEDVMYTYVRDNGKVLTLQEMPSDYCLIDARNEYGFMYSFDMMYFNLGGVDINGYAPEFKRYYNSALRARDSREYVPNMRPELRGGRWCMWQQIPIEKGWVFKFNDLNPTAIPPLASLFSSAIDLEDMRKLQKNKNMLEAYKIIMGVIPRNKDNRTGSQKDDLAITPETAAKFAQLVNSSLPDGVYFKTVPFEQLESFEFKNETDLVTSGIQNLYSNSGTSGYLFASGDKVNASVIKATQATDEAFIKPMYQQFEQFLNYHLGRLTGKFKFNIEFEGTIWDKQQRQDTAMKFAQSGMIMPQKLAASIGMAPDSFVNQLGMSKAMKISELFQILPTAYTQSAKSGEGGAPVKSDDKIGDAGEITRDAVSNEGD